MHLEVNNGSKSPVLLTISGLCCVEYVGCGTDLVTPIIRRYETLTISRQDLLQQLSSLTDEMKSSQNHMESLRQEHNTFKLVCDESRCEGLFRDIQTEVLFLTDTHCRSAEGPEETPHEVVRCMTGVRLMRFCCCDR